MATKLLKPVSREMVGRNRKGRPIIVTLEPGDIIEFRPKGTRQRYSVSLTGCYNLAQLTTFELMWQQKMLKYEEERKLGRRVRRPRKPHLPLDKIYFQAKKLTTQ